MGTVSTSKQNRTAPIRNRVIEAVESQPSMPAMYAKVLSALNNPDIDFCQIAEIIRFDPGITMNVLKAVNSVAFGTGNAIESLQQAAVRLGARRLVNIVMAQGIVSKMSVPIAGYGLEPQILLRHSISVALTAEAIAETLNAGNSDLLFTAGLLHDMGKVILGPFVEEHNARFETLLEETDAPFDVLENEVLGITHAESGSLLMRRWGFPDLLVDVVRMHHDPPSAKKYEDQTLMVHLADTLVYGMGVGDGIDGFRYRVHDHAAELLGLKTHHLEKIAGTVLDQLHIWQQML